MPPARKTDQLGDPPADAQRALPRHVIDIKDLIRSSDNDTSKGHLVINIHQLSPEGISIRRSGDKLTIETCEERHASEKPMMRSYKVPEGGYQELGAQLSAGGILSVRTQGANHARARVVPINVEGMMKMKPGTLIQVDTANLKNEYPMKFAPYVVKGSVQEYWHKGAGAETKEEEKMEEDKSPEPADQDMGDPQDAPEGTVDVAPSAESA